MFKTIRQWLKAIKSTEIRDLDSYVRFKKVSYKYIPFLKGKFRSDGWGRGYPLSKGLKKSLFDNVIVQSAMFSEVTQHIVTDDRVVVSINNGVKWPVETINTKSKNIWPAETAYKNTQEAEEKEADKDIQIYIPIHVMLATLTIGNSALEDKWFSPQDEVLDAYAEAVAVAYDQLIAHGDGQGKLEGLAPIDSETNKIAASLLNNKNNPEKFIIEADDLNNADSLKEMLFSLPRQYRANAKWYINSNTGLHVSTLKDGQGNYLIDQRDESLRTVGVPDRMLGKPIVYNEYISDIENGLVPVILGDLTQAYTIGSHPDIFVRLFDDSAYAQFDQVLMLGRFRIGGQAINKDAYRVLYIKPKTEVKSDETTIEETNIETISPSIEPVLETAQQNT